MKITIESTGIESAKLTLELNGKSYSEEWYKESRGTFTLKGQDIISQMEDDGIPAECTDIEDILSDIDMSKFILISEVEEAYCEDIDYKKHCRFIATFLPK